MASVGFPQEDGRAGKWLGAQLYWAMVGRLWEAGKMGTQHVLFPKCGEGEQGGLYPSLTPPPSIRDQELERRSGRGRDLVEAPENIRRGRREGPASWHRLQEQEPTALGH